MIARDVPWIWPLRVEEWPEPLFLQAIGLRLDDGATQEAKA
jgi:hypothetical protein